MDTLADIIGRYHVGNYLIRKGFVLMRDMQMFNKLYGPLDIKTDFDSTTILIANVNGNHRSKDSIEDLVNSYCPMFVWLMDTRKKWNPPKDYHLVMERNFHKNCLQIRNDIQKGRVISRTPFGIKVDNMAFRYMPPQSKEEKMHWKEVQKM